MIQKTNQKLEVSMEIRKHSELKNNEVPTC